VRVSYSLNSWDSTQHLNLYLVDGNKLKEILKGLTVGFSTTHACYSNAIGVVISISKFPTENFYDLVIATKERSIEGLEDYSNNGACTSSDPVINSTVKTIHFKDGAYDVYGK
jgi:hypothetical protein